MMNSSCFFLLFLVSSISFQPTIFVQGDTNDLISETCKNTKYYDLCVSSLKSNSTSFKADPKDLAVIMVRVGMVNATATNTYLSSQVVNSSKSSTTEASMKRVFKECADKYSSANDALQSSLQDLSNELYDYAYMHVMAAADYPNACHNAFKRVPKLGYPPEIARREDGFKRICDVVLGIIDSLGWS